MVLNQPKYSPIIKINFEELVNIFLKFYNNHARKDGRRVLQPKWHDSVLKVALLSHEGFLAPIFWHDFDLVVP